jgi:hypothetical protein
MPQLMAGRVLQPGPAAGAVQDLVQPFGQASATGKIEAKQKEALDVIEAAVPLTLRKQPEAAAGRRAEAQSSGGLDIFRP